MDLSNKSERARGEDGAAWLVAGLFDSLSPASDIRGKSVENYNKDLQGQRKHSALLTPPPALRLFTAQPTAVSLLFQNIR